MWSQRIPGVNSVSALGATEDIVSTFGNYYLNPVAFDVNTGKSIKSELDGIAMQFEAENLLYLYQTNGLIQAFDRSSGEVLWQRNQSIGSFASSNGVLLIKSDEVGTVTALNSVDGEILWSWRGVIGNVAASNGAVYFLSSTGSDPVWGGDIVVDVELTAVDVKTGAILGTLSFEPGGIQSGGGNYGYNVAANGDTILVYLGDGRQLFALRFRQPS
jgi:outer membrane protein assembly factor BamB